MGDTGRVSGNAGRQTTDGDEAQRLAVRLEYLFDHVQPLGRRHTLQEVVDGIRSAGEPDGGSLSVGRLSMLMNGKATNPTIGTLRALSTFFGVPVAYFVDDAIAEQTMAQLALITAMRSNDVRAVALRAAAVATLSSQGLDVVRGLVEKAGRSQEREQGDPGEPAD
ncbi:helix-turn-helix domain-containing protein [Streptomyces sp. NBC_01481]|uniref:helix-turn-helix domain-containing protein n=1 Tax=Streptomyces sp. NBC_01481 TaxID=2975869 RepID=UPI00225AB3E5|nr:helix-turn-helix domain-containing protein [Streptomyces sp. NBC_01481]MCX4586281.1 helix-turn-helix domain-containing protein [Streptomyces sp. NBC_01481]